MEDVFIVKILEYDDLNKNRFLLASPMQGEWGKCLKNRLNVFARYSGFLSKLMEGENTGHNDYSW